MGRTTNAWVIRTDEPFAIDRNLLVLFVGNRRQQLSQIGFDLGLILGSGRHDLCKLDLPRLIDSIPMKD
jgi:hypothetical protein